MSYAILPLWENHKAKGGFTLLFLPEGTKTPSRQKKGGRYNDYIFRAYTDWYLHCCPCQSLLQDFQGQKKIAAATANSNG